jgi:hypothetical protein
MWGRTADRRGAPARCPGAVPRPGGGGSPHPSGRPRTWMRDFALVVRSTTRAGTIDQEHVHAVRPVSGRPNKEAP